MQQKKVIYEQIEQIEGIKMLAGAFQEISVTKIQSVRSKVLNSRDFLNQMSELFYNVRNTYKKQIEEFLKTNKKDPKIGSILFKNGKTVSVLLSANSKLYGAIVPKVFDAFIEYANTNQSDIVIVGKLGKLIYDESSSSKPYTYFEISDEEVNIEELLPLIAKVLEYEKVMIFYGKFVNIVSQSATFSSISGDTPFSEIPESAKKDEKFIFEPNLEKILVFFESQIIFSLFKQTVNESLLARYASRITAMEQVLEHVEEKLKNLNVEKKRVKHIMANKKQQETMSSINLWR